MEPSFQNFWDTMGVTQKGYRSLVWVEEFAWEALSGNLECGTIMCEVAVVEGQE